MPREATTRICNQSEIACYQAAEDGLLENELFQRLASGIGKTVCNCLPSCTSIEYDAEISQADYDYVKVFNSHGEDFNDEYPGAILARLTIFFKSEQFITSKRSELYGRVDFIANCGGLLGETNNWQLSQKKKINQTFFRTVYGCFDPLDHRGSLLRYTPFSVQSKLSGRQIEQT